MSNLAQIPTDYKKAFDEVLHQYLPKLNRVRTVFDEVTIDSGVTTHEYVRQTQTYAAATGWTSFPAPNVIADGSRPELESIGTEDATSTPVTYGHGYRMDRKIMTSGRPIQQQFAMRHAKEAVDRLETDINNSLITNMISNAAQSYSASATWATTGDAVGDVIAAKNAFFDAAGGVQADFMILNTNEMTDLQKDTRFQSTDYTSSRPLDNGGFTPRPLGLDYIVDPAMTTGSFLLGKKAEFGRMIVSENYTTLSTSEGAAGMTFDTIFTYIDQYHKPYLLMAGTGI